MNKEQFFAPCSLLYALMFYNMDEDLKKLLEEDLRINKENHQMLKSIKRHFVWQKIISFVYLIFIIGPIVWGIFYLPALLKPVLGQYQELFSGASLDGAGASNPGLINQIKNSLK
jgi:hypothetical protein